MLVNGEGRQVQATDTTAVTTFDKTGADSVSITVIGDEPVFVLCNVTAAEFNAVYTAEKSIRIQPGFNFTFATNGGHPLASVAYRTATGVSDIDISAF